MDKMQVEINCDFLSQKITYEEISVILQAIYPSLTGYSIKKKWNFFQALLRPCANKNF